MGNEWLAPRDDKEAPVTGLLMVYIGIAMTLVASWIHTFIQRAMGLYPSLEYPDNNLTMCVFLPLALGTLAYWGNAGSPRRLSVVILGISLISSIATLTASAASFDATLIGFSVYLLSATTVAYFWPTRVALITTGVVNICLLVQMTFVHETQEALTNWIACTMVITGTCLALSWSRDHYERTRRILHAAATTDALTGLANRVHVDELMDSAHDDPELDEAALMICDIDYFKKVNDVHGHLAGDAALRKVAALVQALVADDDIAYRLGGDELAVYMPNKSAADAAALAHRITQAVAAVPVTLSASLEFSVTATAGLAHTRDTSRVRNLYAAADSALYEGKKTARGTVSVADTMTAGTIPEPRQDTCATRQSPRGGPQ